MSQRTSSRIIFAILATLLISPISCLAKIPVLGNEPGEIKITSQAEPLEIRQGECSYSARINGNQTIKYNVPDIIVYEGAPTLHSKHAPYMWQPETYSGYDWAFKNPGRRDLRWFGVICESAENFPFLSAKKSESSPSDDKFLESNRFKCPAEILEGRLAISKGAIPDNNYTIENISQNNWSGFLVLHRAKTSNTYDQMRFCLLHDNVVLIGTTENAQPAPALDEKFRKMALDFAKSINFH